MSREEKILSRIRPGFTEDELKLAREILTAVDSKIAKASSLPSRFVPVGSVVNVRGREYRCIKRSDVHWSDCCSGCSFVGTDCPSFLQCSKFDRRDGVNVWFEEL